MACVGMALKSDLSGNRRRVAPCGALIQAWFESGACSSAENLSLPQWTHSPGQAVDKAAEKQLNLRPRSIFHQRNLERRTHKLAHRGDDEPWKLPPILAQYPHFVPRVVVAHFRPIVLRRQRPAQQFAMRWMTRTMQQGGICAQADIESPASQPQTVIVIDTIDKQVFLKQPALLEGLHGKKTARGDGQKGPAIFIPRDRALITRFRVAVPRDNLKNS